jgi:hypothetical protein
LTLQDLDFGVLSPDHQFEGRLLLQAVHNTLMEVMNGESVLRQEVLDIVLESFAVSILFTLLHGLDEGSHLHGKEGGLRCQLQEASWPKHR